MNIPNGFFTTTGLILVQILYVLTQNCYRGKIYIDNDDVYCEGATSTNVLIGVHKKEDVFYLKFKNSNIRSLNTNTFFEFRRLKMLLLNGNEILQMEPYTFSNLNHLYSLNLSGNLLTEIPKKAFGGAPNISALDLSYNKLTHISFKLFIENRNLTYLNIAHNDLIALNDMITLPKLKYLDATSNKIAKMDVKGFDLHMETLNLGLVDFDTLFIYYEYSNSIVELHVNLARIMELINQVRFTMNKIWRGRLSSILFMNLPKLQTLYLDTCKEFSVKFLENSQYSQEENTFTMYYFWNQAHKSDVVLSGNYSELDTVNIYIDNVSNLTLRNKNIGQLSFSLINNLKNLEFLDLSQNKITSTSGDLILHKLKTFKLSENQIKCISFQFRTPMLKYLSLDSLQLTAFSFDLLKNSKNFNTLDLSRNRITSINGTASLQKLLSIKLIGNEIENLLFKLSATQLLEIDLSHQNLKQFDLNLVKNMTSLQILNASSNSITHISGPSLIPFIRKIDFSNNSISSITNVTFNTTELHLEHNEITHIVNSQPIFNALSLHLENNKISSIAVGAFGYLNKLQYLNLSHNMITDLQIGTFTGLNELISLDLSYNNIKDLKYTSIQIFSKLKYLNIASNKLTDVDYSLSHLHSLETLSADNNSFNCFTLHRMLKHLLETRKVQIIGNNEQSRTNIFGIHCTEESTIANDQNNDKYSKIQNYESPKETHVNTNKNEISPKHMDAINKIHGIFVTLIALVVLLIIFATFIIMRSKLFSLFRVYCSKRENESENIEFM